jgi:hypothetical protein
MQRADTDNAEKSLMSVSHHSSETYLPPFFDSVLL